MPGIDVFIDFSLPTTGFRVSEAIERLDGEEYLGRVVGRVTCVVPRSTPREGTRRRGWRFVVGGAIEACSGAIEKAADAGRPLLVLLGDIEPRCDATGLLLEAIDADPMIGFACPRMKGSRDDSLATLDIGGDRAIDELPRRLLSEIAETYLVADAPARCLLIKPTILANFGGLDGRFLSVAGALWHYMGQARRCGFRTIIHNRAVVSATCAERPWPPCAITCHSLPEVDRLLLRELLPEAEHAREAFGTGVVAPAETRIARALPRAYGLQPSLLLDVRNLVSGMNGTAIAALGILRGLQNLGPEWEISLLAMGEASAFHKLEESFPRWVVHTTLPQRQYTVALRLSQPWNIQEMIDMHNAAAYSVYLFLDTIAWDIVRGSSSQLDGTWRFMADHADGLLFISKFTQDLFRRRFPAAAATPSLVCHLSFEAADYLQPDTRVSFDREGFILVVGNNYDHKDVSRTTALLTEAFPLQPIVAIGSAAGTGPHVTVLESGQISDLDMHRLYSGARAVVFPSFYEGFGLPIVTALAHGQTLLARKSPLLSEIAAQCRADGRIVPFDRRDELVAIVGRLLQGEDVRELPLGTALEDGRPKNWTDVSLSIMQFLADLAGDLSQSRWRSRDHVIRQLRASRG